MTDITRNPESPLNDNVDTDFVGTEDEIIKQISKLSQEEELEKERLRKLREEREHIDAEMAQIQMNFLLELTRSKSPTPLDMSTFAEDIPEVESSDEDDDTLSE